jgi:hypothetical protein
MSFNFNSHAQITKQQAIVLVMDSIVGNQSYSLNVYMDLLMQTSVWYNFAFTSLDSIECPYYLELKELQIGWLEDSRGVFSKRKNNYKIIIQNNEG